MTALEASTSPVPRHYGRVLSRLGHYLLVALTAFAATLTA